MPTKKTVFVAGGTGATGKRLVQLLLDQGHNVRCVVRSKDRMTLLLDPETKYDDKQFQITEATLLDLDDAKLQELTKDCDAVVSCLGHNLTFKGMYGQPRKLVTQATKRLCEALVANDQKTKFILMGSDGVVNPNGQDDIRPLTERTILNIIRWLVPPHVDNEQAALYLHKDVGTMMEWTVVRPTDLIESEEVTEYQLYAKPQGSLFGGGTAARINVADSMVQLITKEDVWTKWKYQMPVLMDTKKEEPKEEPKEEKEETKE